MAGHAVCILTAGMGTRMGAYCEHLNKALLPLGKKAIISHIIERFPKDSEFVIALGHNAQQVKTYLELAHPDLRFSFVIVDNYDGAGSGPGYSVKACKHLLERPFFYISCDTLWAKTQTLPSDSDWLGVYPVTSEQSSVYCNFQINKSNCICAIRDKQRVEGADFKAFIGIGFIKNYEVFWKGLLDPKLIGGELQVSNGINALVATQAVQALEIAEWQDLGDASKYEAIVRQFEAFDFSKFDEALYLINGRVIKYFADHDSARKRVARAKTNPSVFPEVSDFNHGFYCYNFLEGQTLYQRCNPVIFEAVLKWLDKSLWKKINIPAERVSKVCREFYREKTLKRLDKYFKKYGARDKSITVNGEKVAAIDQLLAKVDWDNLYAGEAVFFHGDLHFDHIIASADASKFVLLDWRQEFAGEVEFGDIYYDLAKMQGGFILNYDLIKANLFAYEESASGIFIDFPNRTQGSTYSKILKSYVDSRELSWEKIQSLVPIIYLNMAPLHHYPFDKFLFALGSSMLQQRTQVK